MLGICGRRLCVGGKGVEELVAGERGSRVSDGGKGRAELLTEERGSRVRDVGKGVDTKGRLRQANM